MRTRIKLIYVLLFVCSTSFGQVNQYIYKRELKGIKDQWHKVVLPDEIFGKVLPDLSDIRIFGISEKSDTIEAPYVLEVESEKIVRKEVPFNLINQSKNEEGYYFTFEIPVKNTINLIKLDFKQPNFDWRVKIEGSLNQQEWFSVIEDYRILSIKNERTDFQFTEVAFPDSKYNYFRMNIHSDRRPELVAAKLILNDSIDGNERKHIHHSTNIIERKQEKQTIIMVDLPSVVPVSGVKILVKDTFDYYRPIIISYMHDSIKTTQGWIYDYRVLTSGMLSSVGGNVFTFNNIIIKKLKIVIENNDNEPLQIDSVELAGDVYSLFCRFTEPATYYLTYGNDHANRPQYDLDRFIDKIPEHLKPLQLGNEQRTGERITGNSKPLFQKKIWLWTIMTLIILLLGWFSIGMIRNKQ